MVERKGTRLHGKNDPERYQCRHQKCRTKLLQPTRFSREAFCSKSCWIDFYRRHCPVCETVLPLGGKQRFCASKCGQKYRRNPFAYEFSGKTVESNETASFSTENVHIEKALNGYTGYERLPIKKSNKKGVFRASEKSSWTWSEHENGKHYLCDDFCEIRACVRPDGELWQMSYPRAFPRPIGKLEKIKAAAYSLALASMRPVEMIGEDDCGAFSAGPMNLLGGGIAFRNWPAGISDDIKSLVREAVFCESPEPDHCVESEEDYTNGELDDQ